ncbi:MAG TPA: helix-turn-helix transcriptional regulator [Candidatus Dormibacteraeota bacterium]
MLSGRARGRLSGVDIKPETLRQARVAAGMSLAQVGGLELTRQAVHLIETGKVRPSMRSLRVLAHRLHVPVAALLASTDGDGPIDQGSVAELGHLCRRHQYEQVITRAREILDWGRSPELVAGAHYFMGDALCQMGRPQEALEHLRQARERFESLDDDNGRVAETLELEALALQISEDPQAIVVARDALRLYRALDGRRPEVESRLLQRLGTILAGRMEYRTALAYYEEALEVAGGVRDLVRLARLYHGLALCQSGLGELRAGIALLFKAHTLYEAEERLADAGGKSDLARVENDLGTLLLRQGDVARAEEYLLSSLRRYERAGMERARSHTLLSLGELRQREGRLGESLQLVTSAIDFARRCNEMRTLAVGHRQLGELRAITGERDLAAASFDQALTILREAGLMQAHAECLEVRARALGDRETSAATGTA